MQRRVSAKSVIAPSASPSPILQVLAQSQFAESVFLNHTTFKLVNLTRDLTYEESFKYWGLCETTGDAVRRVGRAVGGR